MAQGVAYSTPAHRTLTDQQKNTMAESAKLAQDRCYGHIYRDANAYAQCLRDLVRPEASDSFKRLGIEYFAFVGALAYVRVSQQGSEGLASEFLHKFRLTQKALAVSDDDLCASVAGNCATRMAQTRQMEAAPIKAPTMRVHCVGQTCRLVEAK